MIESEKYEKLLQTIVEYKEYQDIDDLLQKQKRQLPSKVEDEGIIDKLMEKSIDDELELDYEDDNEEDKILRSEVAAETSLDAIVRFNQDMKTLAMNAF